MYLVGGLHEDHDVGGSDSDGEDVRIPEQMDTGRPQEKQVDLFSEIHLNQMKKLEKQLEGVEGERNALTKSLKEIQDQVEKEKSKVACLQAGVTTVISHIDALNNLKNDIAKRVEKPETPPPVIDVCFAKNMYFPVQYYMLNMRVYFLIKIVDSDDLSRMVYGVIKGNR